MPDEQRKMIFSKNFNDALQKKGIRQIDIVRDLNINSSTVSNWSKGVMLPRSDKLKLLSNYLGVSAAVLMGWNEDYEFQDLPHVNTVNLDILRKKFFSDDYTNQITDKIFAQMLDDFSELNDLGQQEALKRISELKEISKYKKAETE